MPKFLYTIPNFHNPAGVTLAVERRREVLDICAEYGVLVLEDNPYGLLGFDGRSLSGAAVDGPETCSTSARSPRRSPPGLRVGWALAPPAVRDRLVLAAESATLCPPTFNQLLVSRYLTAHDWRGQIKTFTEIYRERRDAMLAALETYLPEGSTWNIPDGGFYVWLTVPEGVDTKAMLPRAVTRTGGVRVGYRVLRRRVRQPAAAAVVLLPDARADHRGRATAGGGPGGRAGRDAHVRQRGAAEAVAAGAAGPVAGHQLSPATMRR